jgi:hypothetical protein
MLRGLDQFELRAIRRRCDWCNIEPFDTKQSFTKRLRDSVDSAVDRDDLTYGEFMQVLRDDILPRPHRPVTQIREVLESIQLSETPIGRERKDEEWFSAQLFGALQAALGDDYAVYLEYELDEYRRDRADIYIEQSDGGGFLIESKLATSLSENISATRGQLRRYHDTIDDRAHTFVFVVGHIEDDVYGRVDDGQQPISEYTNIPSTFTDLEELPKTTVVEWVRRR